METVKIRCKDLMVGDLVANRNGSPMQIVALDEDNAYACEGNEERPWIFGDNEGYEPQPIEITEDIMRKNNWEECDYPLPYNHHEYYYVKDEGGNHLVWNSEVLSIWLDWEEGKDDGAYANIAMPIKYIHQLQQALKLAGLTEMANNFKV